MSLVGTKAARGEASVPDIPDKVQRFTIRRNSAMFMGPGKEPEAHR